MSAGAQVASMIRLVFLDFVTNFLRPDPFFSGLVVAVYRVLLTITSFILLIRFQLISCLK